MPVGSFRRLVTQGSKRMPILLTDRRKFFVLPFQIFDLSKIKPSLCRESDKTNETCRRALNMTAITSRRGPKDTNAVVHSS
ncbi:hypothetical protein MPL3356_340032 [Mesorhizobium plurifarium]|uniref:Uncharacterized protein n=1 Tax=Mesorhizobium plurifarium TaxID=69974 RepID=A0A090E1A0_MESPL|nr:hypothetical protein MPL3356_340032 [Mesorhizobium plurifarium]